MFKSLNKGISIPIAIGIILFVAVLAGGILTWQFWPKQETGIPPSSLPTAPLLTPSEPSASQLILPQETPHEENYLKESICEAIESKLRRDFCYKDLAKEKGEIKFCNKVSGEYNHPNQDECYSEVAATKNDITICEKMDFTIDREQCYSTVAIARENPSLCSKIKSYESYRAQCYCGVAFLKKEPGICDKIENEKIKTHCHNVLTGKAVYSGEICPKKVSLERIYIKEDPCESLNTQFSKNSCHLNLAREEKELKFCKLISDNEVEESCYQTVAIAKKDPNICDKISDEAKRRGCHYQYFVAEAVEKGNPTICEKIPFEEMLTFPSGMTSSRKDYCYEEVAKKNRDLTLCDKIQGSKESCQTWVKFLAKQDELEKKHKEYEIEPISDWKIFRNKEKEYKIKYPSSFSLKEEKGRIRFYFPEVNFGDTSLVLEDSFIEIAVEDECPDWNNWKETITSNNITFYKSPDIGAGCGSGWCEGETFYYTKSNITCYAVGLKITTHRYGCPWEALSCFTELPLSDREQEKLEETLNQMLLTFQFLE